MNDTLLLSLAGHDGKPISYLEKGKPSLLHGRAAAVKMYEDFHVTDTELLQAVACHTFGAPDLCDLAKILYVADKIEPGRSYSTEEYRSKLFKMDLNTLTRTVVQDNISYLEKKKHSIAAETIHFLDSLKQQTDQKQEKGSKK
jgi:nicotinate-nucleotide adenylyltransferase